ncbi:hypothetical protein Phum_PHUM063200 [Pediculus humanus corporis]|uniref:VWFC domain-containing protein n=1 Tax=Pediculus humanus subsp. corporis TaxID=121224 RepID=E0VBJ8_PEDHC|nr:uncharacterized protein Phum_PHUM063200 [Pediculus humanus corporis]EEB10754.1 hypothetical protein Phum_PHUM063200 [Pediculus humanus corporis]
MYVWFVKFVVIFILINPSWNIPLEGEIVKTNEPCLLCNCKKGSLTCNLRVCSDGPEKLLPGCFVVHKPDDCCPQIFCDNSYNDTRGVELRTISKPENETMKENDCIENGNVFAEGSAVSSNDSCEYCYCIRGEIKCIKPHCFIPLEGCKPIHHESSCCPTHYDCNGIFYPEGEKISTGNLSKCENCYCIKGQIKCTTITCPVESKFKNCKPHNNNNNNNTDDDDKCCPISFSCDDKQTEINKDEKHNDNNLETTTTTTELEILNKENFFSTTEKINEEKSTETTTTEMESTTETTTTREETETTTIITPTPTTNFYITNPTNYKSLESFEIENDSKTTEREKILNEETIAKVLLTSEPETTIDSFSLSTNGGKQHEINKEDSSTKLTVNNEPDTDIQGEILEKNSSFVSDDYENYDYNEPKLPPSLPNLIIYPFVAADAIKEDETNLKESLIINYQKNFFIPSIKTEGGFVPKNPTFLDFTYGQNDKIDNNGSEILTVEPPTTKLISSDFTPDPFMDVKPPNLSPVENFNLYQPNRLITKPVTVTYKNAVVNYYPPFVVEPLKETRTSSELNMGGKNELESFVVSEKNGGETSTEITVDNGKNDKKLFIGNYLKLAGCNIYGRMYRSVPGMRLC